MSLFNNTEDFLANMRKSGLERALTGGIQGIAMGVAGSVAKALGGGMLAKTVTNYGANAATNAARDVMNKYVPIQQQRALAVGTGAIGDIIDGDWQAAGMRILESGLIDDLLPGMAGTATQTRYWAKPNPLLGGLTPTEARQIIEDMQQVKFAHTNLFLVEVSSPEFGGLETFNMFVTSVDITPNTITGEKRKIGAAVVDTIQSAEATEINLTTMDDKEGTLKKWFEAHCGLATARDGTVGLPSNYLIKFKIVHSYLSKDTMPSDKKTYINKGKFRPNSMELSLSRRDSELQEIRMSFTQLDTFM